MLIVETLENFIKQNTQQKGKIKNKKEEPSPSQENKTQSGSQRGEGTKHVRKPH
jgi:hypothetical protein